MHKPTGNQVTVLAAVYMALLFVWVQEISGSAITRDALATVIPAVNLSHDGIYSLDRQPPLTPTMYREPVPVLVTAASVSIVDAIVGKAELEAYLSGERAWYLKLQNLLWLTLLCSAAYLVAYYFTSSFGLSVAAGVMSYLFFLYPAVRPAGADSLQFEITAATLLLLGSWFYAVGVSRQRVGMLAAAGLCFGLLALTKALALYVFVGLLIVLLCFRVLHGWRTPGAVVKEIGVLVLTSGVLVGPWIYRNWVEFDSPAISERGGVVMYLRALYNEVTPVEYRGLYYVWAPSPIRPVVGRLTGFTPDDLRSGGRLMRLNTKPDSGFAAADLAAERAGRPDATITLVATARAERVKIRKELKAAGHGHDAHVIADNALRDRAVQIMLENPLKWAAVTVAVLWRGAVLVVPLLAWAVVHSLRSRRNDVLLFCVPAIGFVLLLAMCSLFEPRYSAPMTPVALIAAAAIASRKNWPALFPIRRRRSLKAPA